MPDTVLAIDLGASGLRVALVDAEGGLHHAAGLAHTTGDEADPEAWWSALAAVAVMVRTSAAADWSRVACVCATGFTRTQVLLDVAQRVVRPAITFRDVRAASVAAEVGFDPFHPAARLLWLARNEPDALASAVAVVDPKDFLNARLTGRTCTDTICGARLEGRLPATDLLPPLTVIGHVRPGSLDGIAGCPVVMAAHDTWASVLGLGAMRPGAAYSLSGSTDVLGVLTDAPETAPGLLTDRWGELWHLGGPSNAGGDSLAWLMGLVAPGEPVGSAIERVLRAPRQAQRALFLPYLNGERTPYWDAALRAGFIGLHRSHGASDLVWAVMEGVACLNRNVLDRAEAACGEVAALRFGGGGAASPAWRQVKADVLDRPVIGTAEPECGLLGAGIAGWTALGRFPSLIAAQDAMVRVAGRHEPGRDTADLLRQFRAAEAAVAPLSRELADCPA